MSSIKPTGYPEWAGASSASGIVEPTDSKKQTGWVSSERPAAQYMNWLQEKQSAWIRYMSYDSVIIDDFNSSIGVNTIPGAGQVGGTGLFPWSVLIGGDRIALANEGGNPPIPPAVNALGAVSFWQTGGSGFSRMTVSVGSPENRDVILELVTLFAARGTGMTTKAGIFRGGVNGADMWFGATGPSSSWFFNYGPAEGWTSINLGVDPVSPSAYQTLIAERRGSTMIVEVNGVRKAAIQSGATHSIRQANAELYLSNGVSGGSTQWLVDKFRFGVRR
jgi:hypothetical protein